MQNNQSEIKSLNLAALHLAEKDNWSEAFDCINKRQQLIEALFLKPSQQILSQKNRFNQILDDVQTTDKKLLALATEAKTNLSGKIMHLSLSKKASATYQQVASQP